MTLTARQTAAIEVFRSLGWASASVEDVEQLPLGTPEQQRVARDGLASGEWGEFGQTGPRTYGWTSWTDVDEGMLRLFAVRVGVDAGRSARLLMAAPGGDELRTRVVSARGDAFAARFVEEAERGGRAWEHSTSALGGVTVRLVDRHDLPVPRSVEYLKDWAAHASIVLTGVGEVVGRGSVPCDEAVIRRRFAEHVRAAVAVGVPATGPFGAVPAAGVERGWLDRDEAVELVLTALDAAQRPGDRKVWAQVLTGPLGLTDDELAERADLLVGVLAHGDGPVVEALGPRLVARAGDDVLGDVLAVTLPVRTKKVLRALLARAAARPRPADDVVEAVAPLVLPHVTSTDRPLVRAAQALVDAWGIAADDHETPEDEPPAGLWRPTPPVWEAPRLALGEVSAAALTDAAAALTGRPEGVVDVDVERFLALANAVAATDPDGARSALGGVRPSWVGGLRCIPAWVRGEDSDLLDRAGSDGWGRTVWEPHDAREASVVRRLGEVPVLLSTPTWVDLRLDPADLVDRLTSYLDAGAVASEADLFLALTRTDGALVTDDLLAALDDRPVPVVMQDGSRARFTAGPVARAYLTDPVTEPPLAVEGSWRHWAPQALVLPRSLRVFPSRLRNDSSYDRVGPEVFPTWGDAAWTGVGASDGADVGLRLRQAARRASPLTPGLAVNLVAAQRGFHPAAAADGSVAVLEAWERGLLRPGVADVGLLDWAETPTGLAALARACGELAAEGLLSVVWPLLDDLLVASLRASRLLAGTSEVAETMRTLAPAVLAAVERGEAAGGALDLPGLRALAARPGSSRAVVAARAVVDRLPTPAAAVEPPVPDEPPARPFDEVWPTGAGTRPAVVDGASLTTTWVSRTGSSRMLAVDVDVPGDDGGPYRVAKTWFYDLTNEGQCAAVSAAAVASGAGTHDAWLHWDESTERLVVMAHRDWLAARDRPLERRGAPVPPLTTSMVAVVLASLCHDDGGARYYVHEVLRDGLVGAASVTVAVRALLQTPDFSPARVVGLLEADPTTLPVLWPVLVESVRHGGSLHGPLPRWVNRVLDVALVHASHLREAARRGLLPADAAAWPGLAQLGERRGGTAPGKARELRARVLPD